MHNISSKIFKKEFIEQFPGDHSGSTQPRQTPGKLYSKSLPTPVANPSIIGWSKELAHELGVEDPDEKDVAVLGGNLVTPSMYPYAACYAGHQFGNWAGQLGDGRAITLGEWESQNGHVWEFQLKGAGPTAYSRRADGRAVLRSSVREYLMSEAMHYLGVPTTRALSLVSTGDMVVRDMFYDGNPEEEPGAIVLRVAPSFLRFGNFEMLAAREEIDNLRKLVDWTISKFYPSISGEDKIINWYKEIVSRTADLMVEWHRVGFVHGVMNTDNMSILGLTIDYGPFSFLDDFDLDFTPNTTDLPGRRYAFGNQTSIAYWNLGCLANAIAPLFDNTEELVKAIESYPDIFYGKYYKMMGNKLGLDEAREEDRAWIDDFEKMLAVIRPDMTLFYQLLIDLPLDLKSLNFKDHFKESLYQEIGSEQLEQFAKSLETYQLRIKKNNITREAGISKMRTNNPRFVLRNYLLHEAIEGLKNGDNELFLKLEQAIKEPYSKNHDPFFAKRPGWAAQKAGCSMLSCSS